MRLHADHRPVEFFLAGLCSFVVPVVEGFNLLTDPAGTPVLLTVHVIDASGEPEGTSLLARYGGGTHASVNLADPDALLERFLAVLRLKANTAACGDNG
jgi:hypothetical protein